MDLLDYASGVERLRKLGYVYSLDGSWEGCIPIAAFRIPADSGHKTALARLLVRSVFGGRGVVFGITERGIWPSCENEDLFIRYRSSFAAYRSIDEAPFHFASADEGEYVEGMLALSMYFIWGAVIASETDQVIVRTSHDEWLEVAARGADRFADLCELLAEFGLSRID